MAKRLVLIFGLIVATFLVALLFARPDPLPAIQTPSSITLYSIDGTKGSILESNDNFHSFPVLGKLEVTDVTNQQKLVAGLKSGIQNNNGTAKGCFWPRHGVSFVENGERTDCVICYECLQVKVIQEGGNLKSAETHLTAPGNAQFLNELLTTADITLAPAAN